MSNPPIHEADVIVVGCGSAGSCAAIQAFDEGASVLMLEKQPEDSHYSNTRMSGGGFHCPTREGKPEALKAYARALFSGVGLSNWLDGAHAPHADELAQIWADHAPDNEAFMRGLDPNFKTTSMAGVGFPEFPGANESGYAVVRSTYTGTTDEATQYRLTRNLDKSEKEAGEAFNACLQTGLRARGIPIHYDTSASGLVTDAAGAVMGLDALCAGQPVTYRARRAVILTCGGYQYNANMRKAFLEGPGVEGWAFYGTMANTGDGIRMALRVGAALSKIGSVAGRIIAAVPERRHGVKVGFNTNGVGKPNEIVVDSHGQRFASERRITKDPSRYHFYKEAMLFNTVTFDYPRIPSWMVFDENLRSKGPVVRSAAASYHGIDWDDENLNAIEKGWILKADTLEELALKIRKHPDNRERMDVDTLVNAVATYNRHCAQGHDPDFEREANSLGPVEKPPFYALPLYPGGPNTKGGLSVNAKRQVLDWQDRPIPRLYAVGEIASVFQFAYQGGGNLAEGIVFGRYAGRMAAGETPVASA